MRSRRTSTLVLAAWLLAAPGAWLPVARAAVGPVTDVHRDGDTLVITAGADILIVEVCRPDILRVDYRPAGAYAAPTAIIGVTNWPAAGAVIDASGDPIIIETSDLRAEINRDPCRLRVFDASGDLLVGEAEAEGLFVDGIRLQGGASTDYYGIHGYYVWDNTSARMLRNGGGTVDAGFQGDSGAPLVFTRAGYGLLVDSDGGQFTISGTNLTFEFCSQPNILCYVVAGKPMEIMQGFMEISGKPPMLPKWAMGFANTEWGIDQAELTNIVATYRQKAIPIDQYVLDFDWKAWGEDDYGEWRWNTGKFPDGPSGQLMQDMAAAGIKLGGIMKPRIHVETEQGSHATAHGFWWPGQAAYSDYFSGQPVKDANFAVEGCRQWYFDHITNAFATGITGWWNDEADQAGGGGALFGNWQFMDMQRALYDGQRAITSQRVWSINRNFYLGSQRYAYAMWSGDIDGGFGAMANERARMLASLNVGGVKWGMDIGGFNSAHLTTPECYARWMQFGAVVPIYRVHGQQFNQRQPWVYGVAAEQAAKAAIQLRYRLLPYIYAYERTAYETGIGIVRPLFYHWPDDPVAANHTEGWMFGDWLLAAPVVEQGVSTKNVYLPEGVWYDYFRGGWHGGGQTLAYTVNSGTWTDLPLFIRRGAILPTQPVMSYVGEQPLTHVTIDVFPDWTPSTFTYYDDDGETYAYEDGYWFKQRMETRLEEGRSVFDIHAAEGGFMPDLLTYLCRIHGPTATAVLVNGHLLAAYPDAAALDLAGGEGWYPDEDRFGPFVHVKVDAGAARSIVVSNDLVSPPVLEPAGGNYNGPVSVTISSRTEGAVIRYTLDGGDPDETSALYSGPLVVWSTAMLKARAFVDGRAPSEVVAAGFTIDNNLLRNAGFESPGITTTNRALHWYPGEPDDHGDMWGSARRVNWRSHEGAWQGTVRGLWANAGSEGGFWQEAEGVPGQTYRFSAWFWADSTWSASRQGLKLEFLSGQPAGTNYLLAVTNLAPAIGQAWTQVAMQATAPAGTEWVRVVVFAEGAGSNGALQFDELNLEAAGGMPLLVVSEHGAPVPSRGTHFFHPGQVITNQVDLQVTENGTQYVCAGWTMTGNDPVAGTNHVMAMSLTNQAVLTWLWSTNVPEPSVLSFSGMSYTVSETSAVCVIEVRRSVGTAGVAQVQYATVDGSAIAGVDFIAASGIVAFASGQTSATFQVAIVDDLLREGDQTFTVVLSAPVAPAVLGTPVSATVTIVDDDPDLGSRTLTITSPHGHADPPEGEHPYPYGSPISARITNIVFVAETQYVVSGWSGTGGAPPEGVGSVIPVFLLTNDAAIAWRWVTNVRFEVTADGAGSVIGPASGWLPLGTALVLEASAHPGSRFAGWQGDVDAAQTNDNPLPLLLDRARVVHARFVPLPNANLLNNPGFEIQGPALETAYHWTAGFPDLHGEMWGTALRVNWQPLSGSWHGAIRGTWSGLGSEGGFWQEVPAVPGARYRFRAWFWADDGNPWGPWYAAQQQMKIEFFSGGAMIGAATNPLGVVDQVWRMKSMDAVAPSGAEWVRVVISAYGVGPDGALQFDDLELEVLTELPAPLVLPPSATNAAGFTAAWTGVPEATGYLLDVATNAAFRDPVFASDLFISEYAEGSSDNKAVELCNLTGREVDLGGYRIWGINNGGGWPESELIMSGMLAHGAVHVIRNSAATDQVLIAVADVAAPNAAPMNFNGDDAVGLAKVVGGSVILIDAVGDAGPDPGAGWGVSGVADATRNHTLVRRAGVVHPNADWSTCSNEWDVSGMNVFTNLGYHAVTGITAGDHVAGYRSRAVDGMTSLAVTGLQPGVTYYFRVVATNADGISGYSGTMEVTTPAEVTVHAGAGAGGSIDPAGMVMVPAGGSTHFLVTASAHHHIVSVTTNGAPVALTNTAAMSILWPALWSDGAIAASFAPRLATNGTPEWWLHLHYGETDYDTAALGDSDGDGVPAWEEYRADTDPTNAASVLDLRIDVDEAGASVMFPSSTARLYRLEFLPQADADTWSVVAGHEGLPGGGGAAVMTDTNRYPQGYYRIGVAPLPEP